MIFVPMSEQTHLAPKPLLKEAIVAMPTLGGIIMVLFGR